MHRERGHHARQRTEPILLKGRIVPQQVVKQVDPDIPDQVRQMLKMGRQMEEQLFISHEVLEVQMRQATQRVGPLIGLIIICSCRKIKQEKMRITVINDQLI